MRTPEQVTADEALTAALEATLRAYDLLTDDEQVLDYAVAYQASSFEMLDEGKTIYGTVYRDGAMSDHAALGLFQTAILDFEISRHRTRE